MELPQEIIRSKRDGAALTHAQIGDFVRGLVDGGFSDAQAGAMAMAIVLRGMDTRETASLTHAMTHSGEVLNWDAAGLQGPVLDKHSTGGVGDKVSLMLAPMLAACGAAVPMISGRGLGHTGGTLDKLEALAGYATEPPHMQFLATLRAAGCAIVGASPRLAPADRRLYAIRDVTATVESLPLITASILSKKLAAGLQALVLDVKVGNGAVTPSLEAARALATSLVRVARAAGLPTVALITDMNQVLGSTAGNALEVAEALAFLTGEWPAGAGGRIGHDCAARDERLLEVTLALAGQALHLGGLAASVEQGRARAARTLADGAAAERFARMVAALGGPKDVLRQAGLPRAAVVRALRAERNGVLTRTDTRTIGLAVVELGGGRRRPGDTVDPRVGLAGVLATGTTVQAGQALAWVHAADEIQADRALQVLAPAFVIGDAPPSRLGPGTGPVLERLGGEVAADDAPGTHGNA
jgi:thymidine phosphorylase